MHIRRPELYEEIPDVDLPEDCSFERALDQGLKHRLKKFQKNIYWDELYQESAVYDYIEAFRTGFNLDKYSFARECFEHSTLSANRLYEFHITMIRRKEWNDPFQKAAQSLAVNFNNAWFYCYQFTFDFNATFYAKFDKYKPCEDIYSNGQPTGVRDCSGRRREIFLSFMFNLIQESMNIRDAFVLMNQTYADHDSVEYFRSMGNMLRILYNFDSYNTYREQYNVDTNSLWIMFLEAVAYGELPTPPAHNETNELAGMPTKAERQQMYQDQNEQKKRDYYAKKRQKQTNVYYEDEKFDLNDCAPENRVYSETEIDKVTRQPLVIACTREYRGTDCNTGKEFPKDDENSKYGRLRQSLEAVNPAARYNLTTGCAKNGTAWNWTVYDYASAPFAFLTGSLNALGKGSFGTYCSRYTLSARTKFLEADEGFQISRLEGYTSIHDGFLFFDNIAYTCYNSFSKELSGDHFTSLANNPVKIGINLLYNFGAMYNDIIKYIYYDPFTVENNDWPFFVFFHLGDFVMRFFFNPSDAGATVTTNLS